MIIGGFLSQQRILRTWNDYVDRIIIIGDRRKCITKPELVKSRLEGYILVRLGQ